MAANRLKADTFPIWKTIGLWIVGNSSIISMPSRIGKHIKNPAMRQRWNLLVP